MPALASLSPSDLDALAQEQAAQDAAAAPVGPPPQPAYVPTDLGYTAAPASAPVAAPPPPPPPAPYVDYTVNAGGENAGNGTYAEPVPAPYATPSTDTSTAPPPAATPAAAPVAAPAPSPTTSAEASRATGYDVQPAAAPVPAPYASPSTDRGYTPPWRPPNPGDPVTGLINWMAAAPTLDPQDIANAASAGAPFVSALGEGLKTWGSDPTNVAMLAGTSERIPRGAFGASGLPEGWRLGDIPAAAPVEPPGTVNASFTVQPSSPVARPRFFDRNMGSWRGWDEVGPPPPNGGLGGPSAPVQPPTGVYTRMRGRAPGTPLGPATPVNLTPDAPVVEPAAPPMPRGDQMQLQAAQASGDAVSEARLLQRAGMPPDTMTSSGRTIGEIQADPFQGRTEFPNAGLATTSTRYTFRPGQRAPEPSATAPTAASVARAPVGPPEVIRPTGKPAAPGGGNAPVANDVVRWTDLKTGQSGWARSRGGTTEMRYDSGSDASQAALQRPGDFVPERPRPKTLQDLELRAQNGQVINVKPAAPGTGNAPTTSSDVPTTRVYVDKADADALSSFIMGASTDFKVSVRDGQLVAHAPNVGGPEFTLTARGVTTEPGPGKVAVDITGEGYVPSTSISTARDTLRQVRLGQPTEPLPQIAAPAEGVGGPAAPVTPPPGRLVTDANGTTFVSNTEMLRRKGQTIAVPVEGQRAVTTPGAPARTVTPTEAEIEAGRRAAGLPPRPIVVPEGTKPAAMPGQEAVPTETSGAPYVRKTTGRPTLGTGEVIPPPKPTGKFGRPIEEAATSRAQTPPPRTAANEPVPEPSASRPTDTGQAETPPPTETAATSTGPRLTKEGVKRAAGLVLGASGKGRAVRAGAATAALIGLANSQGGQQQGQPSGTIPPRGTMPANMPTFISPVSGPPTPVTWKGINADVWVVQGPDGSPSATGFTNEQGQYEPIPDGMTEAELQARLQKVADARAKGGATTATTSPPPPPVATATAPVESPGSTTPLATGTTESTPATTTGTSNVGQGTPLLTADGTDTGLVLHSDGSVSKRSGGSYGGYTKKSSGSSSSRGTSSSSGGRWDSMFWKDFPFGQRPNSPLRQHILDAIAASLARGQARK